MRLESPASCLPSPPPALLACPAFLRAGRPPEVPYGALLHGVPASEHRLEGRGERPFSRGAAGQPLRWQRRRLRGGLECRGVRLRLRVCGSQKEGVYLKGCPWSNWKPGDDGYSHFSVSPFGSALLGICPIVRK